MAWIAVVPPSPRHPHERYQVCYREGTRQRSAGVFPTKRRAEAERRAIERGRTRAATGATGIDLERKARTLVGEYVTTKWWPAWKDQHPSSEYGTRKKVEKRILPTFGNIPLGELDPSTIGTWKAAMVAEGLTARTVNTYLSLLGTILNATVDDDYLPAPRWCARAVPAAPPPPATSPSPAARSGCCASSSTGWPRRSTPATRRWSWSPP